jgi:TonB family protein
MVTALALLLLALASVLYGDREFWFSDREQAGEQTQPDSSPHTVTTSAPPSAVTERVSTSQKKSRLAKAETKTSPGSKTLAVESSATANPSLVTDPSGSPATVTRTVLPALEVEVVAGDVHRTIHPGTNSVRVDLQPGTAPQEVAQPDSQNRINPSAENVTRPAAERVQMSADTAEILSRPVKPDYPMLARQMKVQGSVILQALIGRSGLIQDLRVVSGPPILASAAQEAVKQWHFKPHYQGDEAVETQARITVNFTISTN